MDSNTIDETKIRSFHWRIIFTAGMGFFTDAYDLFVIGIVTAILSPIWHLSITQLAILNGSALAAAAFGAIFFGILADKYGRKKFYGLEVALLFVGAIMSAVSPSFIWLLIARVIVGLGIGGDYPSSAVIASEYANRKHRGFLVLLVFAMQAVGLIFGPLLASLLLIAHIPHEMVWRILLGIGAIPAASVFYLRRKIQETPRYLLTKNSPVEVSRVISDLTGVPQKSTLKEIKPQTWSTKWISCLIGTASAWFLLDVAFYGNSVSSILILKTLNPSGSLLESTIISALIFLTCAVPGYFLSAMYIDRIGRKPLQFLGFGMMGLMFILMSIIPGIQQNIPLFLMLFGVSYFFVNFGPNTTTFLIPSEIFPTNIRAKAHGISAAIGKVGAFVGAFFLPHLMQHYGLCFIFLMMGSVSVMGIFSTFLIPEMKGVSLDHLETATAP
jgi:PHS family inorganic phosphate transporter-like MFS transporter